MPTLPQISAFISEHGPWVVFCAFLIVDRFLQGKRHDRTVKALRAEIIFLREELSDVRGQTLTAYTDGTRVQTELAGLLRDSILPLLRSRGG